MTKKFEKILPNGFQEPTSLPKTEEERREWQERNQRFWQNNPMRYDWNASVAPQEFSKEFYSEIDRRFFENSKEYLPYKKEPFEQLIPLEALGSKDVLEIGVGNGSHAQLLATHAKTFTGIDITTYASESTKKRFALFGLRGNIEQMDAEKLSFSDKSFDFVWSWGVIHHSSHTRKILEEIHRVLRPGGETVIMVYHRGWWNYYCMGLLWQLVRGKFPRPKDIHSAVQESSDGAIARYYAPRDWKNMTKDLFEILDIGIYGPKTDVIPLPSGKLKRMALAIIPNALGRFFSHYCRMGSFFVVKMKKR